MDKKKIKKLKSRKVWFTIIAVCAMIVAVVLILYNVIISPSSSVAIIGGADGPTAITVASSGAWFEVAFMILLSVAFFITAAILIRKTKK